MSRPVFVVLLIPIVLACAPAAGPATPATVEASSQSRKLDHIAPRRDSVGPMPKQFSWTAVDGADFYDLVVYNDIDIIMLKANRLQATSVAVPAEEKLEPGTYFWMITAFQGDRIIADSGRSAFVVIE